MSGIEDSIDALGPRAQTLVTRVKGIIVQPRSEWHVIDGEATSVGQLYMGYIIPLAAITPIATFIGTAIFGIGIPLIGTYHVPMGVALERAVTSYVLALIGVYVLALIIDALAPSFGGRKSQVQALKVAAYSSTASWVVGIVMLVPMLGILAILGLYSLYLLFLGLPIVMKTPADKALPYTVIVIVCAIVIFVIIGSIGTHFVSYPTMGVIR